MIKIYGNAHSRALRCFWAALELGVEFEQVPVPSGEPRPPDFLAINPNGRVPAMVDGDLVLFESMAINWYLAKKAGGPLAPASLAEEAETLKWCFWAVNECETAANAVLRHRFLLPEGSRDETVAEKAASDLEKPLAVFDRALAGKDYLVGDRFTIADLCVANVLSWAKAGRIGLESHPNVQRWLRACLKRPAQKAALALP
jgi:glutathione S-transferase